MTLLRLTLATVVLLAATACHKGDGTASNDMTAAAPVAAKAAPTGKAWTDVVATTPDFGVVMGNPDAPIKLVEYGSRTCPHCAAFDKDAMPELRAKYVATGKVSYEFRDYPIHAQLDIAPILLGHCAGADVFFPLLDQMMANQNTLVYGKTEQQLGQIQQQTQSLTVKQAAPIWAEQLGYLDFVKQRGVPETKARACLSDQSMLDALSKSATTAGSSYNIQGTPTFIINGKVVPDATEWSQVEPALKAAGA